MFGEVAGLAPIVFWIFPLRLSPPPCGGNPLCPTLKQGLMPRRAVHHHSIRVPPTSSVFTLPCAKDPLLTGPPWGPSLLRQRWSPPTPSSAPLPTLWTPTASRARRAPSFLTPPPPQFPLLEPRDEMQFRKVQFPKVKHQVADRQALR